MRRPVRPVELVKYDDAIVPLAPLRIPAKAFGRASLGLMLLLSVRGRAATRNPAVSERPRGRRAVTGERSAGSPFARPYKYEQSDETFGVRPAPCLSASLRARF